MLRKEHTPRPSLFFSLPAQTKQPEIPKPAIFPRAVSEGGKKQRYAFWWEDDGDWWTGLIMRWDGFIDTCCLAAGYSVEVGRVRTC